MPWHLRWQWKLILLSSNKEKKKSKKGQCKCGSTTHLWTSVPKWCSHSTTHTQWCLHLTATCQMIMCHLLVTNESESTFSDDWCYKDDIISSDVYVCGALGRAHKRDCPMTSRSSLPTEVYSADCQSESVWKAVAKRELVRHKEDPGVDKHPVIKKQRITTLRLETRIGRQHVPCCTKKI